MREIENFIEKAVLALHRRNGGSLAALDFKLPLLHGSLAIDSLDLAEIVAEIEREFGKSPFDAPVAPRTWRDVADFLAR